MKWKQKIILISWGLLLLLYTAQTVQGDGGMSDNQKRETVYRLYDTYKRKFPQVTDILPQQVMEGMKKDTVLLVDTRRPAEMKISMLHGAVTVDHFEDRLGQNSQLTVVAYCTIGYRSGLFAAKMAPKGVTVLNLKGGILAWILEGGKVHDANGSDVNRVHVYGKKWDLVPAGYESVKF